ncbi:MAG: discoidin domain-containing protein [Armatimonadota bacterium]
MNGIRRAIGSLAPLILVALLADVGVAQQNVAEGRPFECSTDVMGGWTGLVDGVVDSDSAPGCFATTNDGDFPKSVTIDLQRPCSINRVTVHNSANGNTRGIAIYCSEDGEEYELLREFIFPEGESLVLNHRFNDRPAQFVRVEFTDTWGGGLGGDNTIFCREIEVFGSPTGDTPVVRPMSEPDGDPLVTTRELRLFRRWALGSNGDLTLGVLGDSLASCEEQTWPQTVAEDLALARPEEADVSVTAMTERGLRPSPGSGYVGLTEEADPDVLLVTFGTDLDEWDAADFRRGLAGLVNRLIEETDALIVLVGPAVGDAERIDIGRRALQEMERLADLLSLPMLRTEAAMVQEGLSADEIRDDDGALTEEARAVLATAVLELLLQPQT